jgi:hypothetical protein
MDFFANQQNAIASPQEETVHLTEETVRWRARDATFLAGKWNALSKRIPSFSIEDFKVTAEGPANPHIRTVVRLPLSVTEQRIPVGIVSNTYQLVQHADVAAMCIKGVNAHGVNTSDLRCEVGLTTLGEWMNFRIHFPDSFSFTANDKNALTLRLECFNSVDGSSRLVVQLSWFRLICSNGMTIKETMAVLSDIHNQNLNLGVIPEIIAEGLTKVRADKERLQQWEQSPVESLRFDEWVDGHLAERWGKKAACRALHICRSGADVELVDPFAGGKPSEKQTKPIRAVPGAAKPARNLYDVCQALSWIATQRNSADERLEWQGHIPGLIENLRSGIEATYPRQPAAIQGTLFDNLGNIP